MSADAAAAALPADVVAAVDKMAEFKAKHGEAFETLIKQKQRDNPKFSFLFDTSSPAHAYYMQKIAHLPQASAPIAPGTMPGMMPVTPTVLPGMQGLPQQMALGSAFPPMQTVPPAMPGMMPTMPLSGAPPLVSQLPGAAQVAAAAQLQQQQQALHMQAHMAQQHIAQQQQQQHALQLQHQQRMLAQQQLALQQQMAQQQAAMAQQVHAAHQQQLQAQQAEKQVATPGPVVPEKRGPAYKISVGALASVLHEKRPLASSFAALAGSVAAGRDRMELFKPLLPHEVPAEEPFKEAVRASVLAAVDIFYAGGKPEVAERMKLRIRGDNNRDSERDPDWDRLRSNSKFH